MRPTHCRGCRLPFARLKENGPDPGICGDCALDGWVDITTHSDPEKRFLTPDGRVMNARGELVAAALADNHPEAWRKGRTCRVPPPGWRCTRAAGHGGPCAAVPVPTETSFWRSLWSFLKESW